MKLKLSLIFFIICLGCSQAKGPGSWQVVPLKQGLLIHLEHPLPLKEIQVKSPLKTISFLPVDSQRDYLLDYPWKKNRTYRITLKTETGKIFSKSVSFTKPEYFLYWQHLLDAPDKVAEINHWSKVLYESIDVTEDGLVAVATFDGSFKVFNKEGKEIFSYHLPLGRGYVVKLFRHYLLAGEKGKEGYLYCFDIRTKKLLWRYPTAKEVGRGSPTDAYAQPRISAIVMHNETIYVAANHSWREVIKTTKGKEIRYAQRGVIYAFSLSGQLKWRFPKHYCLKTGLLRLALDKAGRFLVFGGWGGEGENQLYVLDAQNGEVIWRYLVSPLPRYGFKHVSLGTGVTISPNGRYVVCCNCDGRLLVFDKQASVKIKRAVLLWQKEVVSPIFVSGLPIYAYAGKSLVNDQGEVLILIGNTYIAPAFSHGRLPQMMHPLANLLYLFGADGEPKWIWQAPSGIQARPVWDARGRFLAVVLQHNYIKGKKEGVGLYLFDLQQKGSEKLLWHFPLEGIGLSVAISPEGHFIVVIEGPIDLNPDPERERCVGKHRVYLFS